MGILKLSKGTLLEYWVDKLNVWFGWGSLLVVLLAGAAGVQAFRRSLRPVKTRWGRVIALELAAFLTLALLAALSGNQLSDGNMWGGQVGWGLSILISRYVGTIWGGLIIFILWALAVFATFGIWQSLETWLI